MKRPTRIPHSAAQAGSSRHADCAVAARRCGVLLACLLTFFYTIRPVPLGAANIAPDFPLREQPVAREIALAPLIVEGAVIEAGSFQATVEIDHVYKNGLKAAAAVQDGPELPMELPRCVRVTGFNSMAGDRSARAMRQGERVILFLAPAGDLYFTPRSGAGRFVIETAADNGDSKVVVSLGDASLLVPLDPEHFRTLLQAVIAFQSLAQAPAAGPVEPPENAPDDARRSMETKEWLQQVEQGEILAQQSLLSSSPVRQYFGIVLARALLALARLPELVRLSESDNPRVQAESLEALAALVRYWGFDHPRLDRAAILRAARTGLSAKSARTRLAAALALQEMPADGVARDLLIFYRDATAEFFKLKTSDEKRIAFVEQRDHFWLSPALLNDPAAEAVLLDFAGSNDSATATGALGVLGLRGSAASIPGLAEMLSEKDFKYVDDARVALFRIALSDEVLQKNMDLKTWAAAASQQGYLERLKAGLERIDQRLNPPAGVKVTDEERQNAVVLASCMPGEASLPRLVRQTAVDVNRLSPVLFARTQSPLAFPYLAAALLSSEDDRLTQAELALRGWAAIEPLARFGCDSELGIAAARHTSYGDNPGLDACADLTPPRAAFGIIAGMSVETSSRYRGRRFQLLQAFTGQSYGWGENEVEWNTALCLWAQFQAAQACRYQFAMPPELREWLAGAKAGRSVAGSGAGPLDTATLIQHLGDADPRVAHAAWRTLALAGSTFGEPPFSTTDTALVRNRIIRELTGLMQKTDAPVQAKLHGVNLLGFLRASEAQTLVPLLAQTTDPALRHQLWWALGRAPLPEAPPATVQEAWLTAVQKATAATTDSYEKVLAIWSLQRLPGADEFCALVIADDGNSLVAQQTAAAVLLYRACHQPTKETLLAVGRALNHPDAHIRERLLTALGANQGNLTPALRETRLIALARALSQSTSANYDLPAALLRTELEPLPCAGPAAWTLPEGALEILHGGYQKAFTAAAAANDPMLGDASDRAYGWAFATGGWPGKDFNDIQRDGLDPFGRWPIRRARIAAYALEGLIHSGGTLPAARLRTLLTADDDRLAGLAALLLARYNQADDHLDIFNRFNRALPKTQTWLNAIAATSSPDAYKFLTDTAKSAGYDAYMAGWALGQFNADGARIRLTQAATDARQSNASAAIFGWTAQLKSAPERMADLAQGDMAQQLLLCNALEGWPPPRLAQAAPHLISLLSSKEALVRARAQMVLCRLSGLPPFPAVKDAHGEPPLAAPAKELVSYWTGKLAPPAPASR